MKTIVVTAAVVEQDGTFLVTHRVKGTHLGGTWEFPGGKCEEEETLEACIRSLMPLRIPMEIVVVLHRCTDASESIVRAT